MTLRNDVGRFTFWKKLGSVVIIAAIASFLFGMEFGIRALSIALILLCAAILSRFWTHMRSGYALPVHIESGPLEREPADAETRAAKRADYFFQELAAAFVAIPVCFGFAFFIWQHAHPELFSTRTPPSIANSFYYSFMTFTTTATPPIVDDAMFLKSLVVCEVGSGVIMLGLFLGTLPSVMMATPEVKR